MLCVTTSALVGMAAGPFIVSAVLAIFRAAHTPQDSKAPVVVSICVVFGLFAVVAVVLGIAPNDKPFYGGENAVPPPSVPPAADATAPVGVNKAKASTVLLIDAKPTVLSTVIVQITCLLYSTSRQVVRFSYESAMVVVYEDRFKMTTSAAGMLASGLAATSLLSVFIFKLIRP